MSERIVTAGVGGNPMPTVGPGELYELVVTGVTVNAVTCRPSSGDQPHVPRGGEGKVGAPSCRDNDRRLGVRASQLGLGELDNTALRALCRNCSRHPKVAPGVKAVAIGGAREVGNRRDGCRRARVDQLPPCVLVDGPRNYRRPRGCPSGRKPSRRGTRARPLPPLW